MKKVLKVVMSYWAWLSVFSMLHFLLYVATIAHNRDDFEDTYGEDVKKLLSIIDKYPLFKRVESIENTFLRIVITVILFPYWIWICHIATIEYYN